MIICSCMAVDTKLITQIMEQHQCSWEKALYIAGVGTKCGKCQNN